MTLLESRRKLISFRDSRDLRPRALALRMQVLVAAKDYQRWQTPAKHRTEMLLQPESSSERDG